jgi:hypothetical protein
MGIHAGGPIKAVFSARVAEIRSTQMTGETHGSKKTKDSVGYSAIAGRAPDFVRQSNDPC